MTYTDDLMDAVKEAKFLADSIEQSDRDSILPEVNKIRQFHTVYIKNSILIYLRLKP